MKTQTLDPVWEEKYKSGHAEYYPWDCIVSFVFKHYPKDRPKETIRILEVGCGTGSNLWFAAREGFQVSGVDGSSSAIKFAKARFEREGLSGDLHVGDFTELPFESDVFDLVIDRGGITCCGLSAGQVAVQEVWRVLKSDGYFHANPYSQKSSSFLAGLQVEDGLTTQIYGGSIDFSGQICFYSRRELTKLFGGTFDIISVKHIQIDEESAEKTITHAEWRVVAKPRK